MITRTCSVAFSAGQSHHAMRSSSSLPVAVPLLGQCGRLLETLRGQRTQREVAVACGWSQPTQVDLERGQKLVTTEILEKLRPILGGGEEIWAQITWHAQLGSVTVPKSDLRWRFKTEPMRKLVDMERTATLIRCKASMLLPGMLQTVELMRYLMEVAGLAPEEIDRLIALRAQRQEALLNPAQRFEFIIDQAALARVSLISDTTGIWAGQLSRLDEVAKLPNVQIKWVPFSHGFYLGQESDYHVATYEADPVLNLVYVERYDEQVVLPEPKVVRGTWTCGRRRRRPRLSRIKRSVSLRSWGAAPVVTASDDGSGRTGLQDEQANRDG